MIERNLFTQQAGGGGVPNKKIHDAHFAIRLERVCAASLLLSMMSQVNGYIAMPSYNALLAGWGLFTAYSRSGRAVFGVLCFLGVSLLLDIIFLAIWSSDDADILSRDDGSAAASTTAFSVVMMCMNLAAKVPMMYYAAHLFAVLSPSTTPPPGSSNQAKERLYANKPIRSKNKAQESEDETRGTNSRSRSSKSRMLSEPRGGEHSLRASSPGGGGAFGKEDKSEYESKSDDAASTSKPSRKLTPPRDSASPVSRVPPLNF
mmetsp:Transcript_55937/g.112110  ORF Transcript_55937/g.112110 Transcript_55937/m.112110 type:complete len:261 (+) Transcript_55937:120-902(+)